MNTEYFKEPSQRVPGWLVLPTCRGKHLNAVRRTLSHLKLHTVCQSALCPNQSECFSEKTATFMLMGDICTRNCRFCAVKGGRPRPLDPDEPERIASAAEKLGLAHVVITSVTRDDVPDGGANHFARTIRAIRKTRRNVTVEVLVPDFEGSRASVETVAREKPEVFNHNLETIPRLYKYVRPAADYRRSLKILGDVKQMEKNVVTKSGLMVGLGETVKELIEVMEDLRQVDCDFLTIGQYLRPSKKHAPVIRFLPPEEFVQLKAEGNRMGFSAIASAPFVRSSYKSGELFNELISRKKDG